MTEILQLNLFIFISFFICSAPLFRIPKDPSRPIILIGPGTGIAPFRGFWQHLSMIKTEDESPVPKVWLLFGCRTQSLDLYREEKMEMIEKEVLNKVCLALSREPNIPKVSCNFIVICNVLKRIIFQ